jgi:hypothetical protein
MMGELHRCFVAELQARVFFFVRPGKIKYYSEFKDFGSSDPSALANGPLFGETVASLGPLAVTNERPDPEELRAAAFAPPFPERMHADRHPLSYVGIRKEFCSEFHMSYASVALRRRST